MTVSVTRCVGAMVIIVCLVLLACRDEGMNVSEESTATQTQAEERGTEQGVSAVTTAPTPSTPSPDAPTVAAAATRHPMPTETPEPIAEFGLVEPYPIPPACEVTPLSGPFAWRGFPAYWLIGEGMRAGIGTKYLFVGGNKIYWQLSERGAIELTGERLDGKASSAALDFTSGDSVGTDIRSGVTFETAGCWHIHAESEHQRLDAVVYVFPEQCLAVALQETPETATERCEPPAS